MTDDGARLAVVEQVVTRMEKAITMSLEKISENIGEINDRFAKHEKESIELTFRLHTAENTVVRLQDTVFDESRGLLHRVKAVEIRADAFQKWQENVTATFTKVAWEVAKPIIGLMVTGVLVALALLVVFLYGIQQIAVLIP